jgi:hypothetical protein
MLVRLVLPGLFLFYLGRVTYDYGPEGKVCMYNDFLYKHVVIYFYFFVGVILYAAQ